ncbi:MAG TPA: glycosyltransferase family 4 protein [Bryobacteraceae bacterium]|nr:glycosyltransferase family 4 protein [Bryobacteraceae bacterium]
MKIALVVTDNFSAWNFRRELLSSLLRTGAEVAIITPSGPWDQHLRGLGVRHIPIEVDRFVNPAKDLKFAWLLYRILKRERFSIVHNVSIKPNIAGAFAARWAGAGLVLGSVTGAGTMFSGDAPRLLQLVRPIIVAAYRAAFRRTDRVWFQNPDDLDLFIRSRIVAQDQAVLIRSSGVDTNDFSQDRCDAAALRNLRARIGAGPATVVVSMVARALWNKGVSEFIQASRVLGNESGIDARFVLAGEGEAGNPATVPAGYLKESESRSFVWLGWISNVRELLGASDIVTLLTWDREGVPRSLLEAMAMGRPIVATDVPGCREVIDAGRNGFLVKPKDAAGVIEALRPLIADPGLRKRFGSESRKKAVREFDLEVVNRRLLAQLYRFPARLAAAAITAEQHTHV